MTILESHEVRRFSARSAYVNDLAHPLGLTHDAAMHVESVPDDCLHMPIPFSPLSLTTYPRSGALPVRQRTRRGYTPTGPGSIDFDAAGCGRLRGLPNKAGETSAIVASQPRDLGNTALYA
jgi:hypothetical protein